MSEPREIYQIDNVKILTEAEKTLILELRRMTDKARHSMVIVRNDGIAWQVFKALPVGKVARSQ